MPLQKGMRIVNLMFGRNLGGIEQAFLDYNEALLLAGHQVLAVTQPMAEINPMIQGALQHETLANWGNWDPFAIRALRRLLTEWKPDAIICHGNRALNLASLAKVGIPLIYITHNYQLQHIDRADFVLALTRQLYDQVVARGVPAERIGLLPNMVAMPARLRRSPHPTPVIGTFGRLIDKKGFDHLLRAAAKLRDRGIAFHLRLGGRGHRLSALRNLVTELGLDEQVEFAGWVRDKAAFFQSIDLFCLPSRHEPFGIVLLEAMAHGVAVVSTRCEGPAELIGDEALLVPLNDVDALADAIERVATDGDFRGRLADAGRDLVESHYSLPIVSKQLDRHLDQWIGQPASRAAN